MRIGFRSLWTASASGLQSLTLTRLSNCTLVGALPRSMHIAARSQVREPTKTACFNLTSLSRVSSFYQIAIACN